MSEGPTDQYEYMLRYGKHKRNLQDKLRFEPTDAIPGSAEKIEIMRQRVAAGLPVFHQHDRVDMVGLKLGVKPV